MNDNIRTGNFGNKVSPEQVLRSTSENVDDIEVIIVVTAMKDGTIVTAASDGDVLTHLGLAEIGKQDIIIRHESE